MEVANNNKISLMDALLIYIGAVYVPGTRYLFTTVETAKQAAWLVPIASLIVFIPLIYVLSRVMKAFEGQSLYQIMCRVFGKIVAKIISIILAFWLFIWLCMFMRYAGDTIVLTSYGGFDVRIFLFIAAVTTAIVLRSGLPTFSRMATIIFKIGILQFVIILVFLFAGFNSRNVTPISTYDIIPILGEMNHPLTILCTITFLFIFNDQIWFGKKYASKFLFTIATVIFSSIALMLAVLGLFGADIVNKLQLPFHTAVANIPVFGGETVIAALFILIWTSYEFVLGTVLAYLVVRLLRDVFGLKREVPLLTALMGLAFVFSMYFYADMFEYDTFSRHIEPWISLPMSLGIPFSLFFIAKARKMLPPLK